MRNPFAAGLLLGGLLSVLVALLLPWTGPTEPSPPSEPAAVVARPPEEATAADVGEWKLLDALHGAAMRSTSAAAQSPFAPMEEYYCERVDRYRATSPASHFPRHLHTDLPRGYLPREVLRTMGWMDPRDKKHPDSGWLYASPSAQLFWFRRTYLFSRYGTGFPCAGQVAKFMPGCEYAGSKAAIVGRLAAYEEAVRDSGCFSSTDMMPPSYRLNVQSECERFVELVRQRSAGAKHPSHVQWILKIGEGVQNARGLTLYNATAADKLVRGFVKKQTCVRAVGKRDMNIVAQEYLRKPLLFKNKKIDFRVYLFVASADPLVAFFYTGFVRRAAIKYVHTADEPNAHFSNIARAKKSKRYRRDKRFRHAHVHSMEELQEYVFSRGYTNDPNWVRDSLKAQMKEQMVHILNAVDKDIEKWQGRFSIWGLDFMLDRNLKLWFLEVNTAPNLNTGGGNPKTLGLKTRLLQEVFLIEEAIIKKGVQGVADVDLKLMEPLIYRTYHRKNLVPRRVGDPLAYLHHTSYYFGNVQSQCIDNVNEAVTTLMNRDDGRGVAAVAASTPPPKPQQQQEKEQEKETAKTTATTTAKTKPKGKKSGTKKKKKKRRSNHPMEKPLKAPLFAKPNKAKDKRKRKPGTLRRFAFEISGAVQGVFFRKYTRKTADDLDVSGFVQNRANGKVAGVAEGRHAKMRVFENWICKVGSPTSQIAGCKITHNEPKVSDRRYSSFEIVRGGYRPPAIAEKTAKRRKQQQKNKKKKKKKTAGTKKQQPPKKPKTQKKTKDKVPDKAKAKKKLKKEAKSKANAAQVKAEKGVKRKRKQQRQREAEEDKKDDEQRKRESKKKKQQKETQAEAGRKEKRRAQAEERHKKEQQEAEEEAAKAQDQRRANEEAAKLKQKQQQEEEAAKLKQKQQQQEEEAAKQKQKQQQEEEAAKQKQKQQQQQQQEEEAAKQKQKQQQQQQQEEEAAKQQQKQQQQEEEAAKQKQKQEREQRERELEREADDELKREEEREKAEAAKRAAAVRAEEAHKQKAESERQDEAKRQMESARKAQVAEAERAIEEQAVKVSGFDDEDVIVKPLANKKKKSEPKTQPRRKRKNKKRRKKKKKKKRRRVDDDDLYD